MGASVQIVNHAEGFDALSFFTGVALEVDFFLFLAQHTYH